MLGTASPPVTSGCWDLPSVVVGISLQAVGISLQVVGISLQIVGISLQVVG